MSTGARITIAVVALLCGLGFGITALTAPEAFPNPNAIYGCAVVCLLIALSCLTGPVGTTIRRILAGVVLALYLVYLVKEFTAPTPVILSGSRSKPSIVNAFAGLILIGIPSGLYAIFGNRLLDWFKSLNAN